VSIVSEEKQALFLANPGTGSSSIEKLLLETLHWKQVGKKHDGYEKLAREQDFELGGYFVFTTVRNPFDFLASEFSRFRGPWARLMVDPNCWIHKDKSVKERIKIAVSGDVESFVEYYLKHAYAPNGRWRYEYWGHAQFVMRTESLQLDFNNLLRILRIPEPIELPLFNATSSEDRVAKESLFSGQLVNKIVNAYRPYFELFGYEQRVSCGS
jgi:hypothetical protein